jgi:hypothetical protein
VARASLKRVGYSHPRASRLESTIHNICQGEERNARGLETLCVIRPIGNPGAVEGPMTGLSRGRFQMDGRTDERSDDGRGGVRDLDAL